MSVWIVMDRKSYEEGCKSGKFVDCGSHYTLEDGTRVAWYKDGPEGLFENVSKLKRLWNAARGVYDNDDAFVVHDPGDEGVHERDKELREALDAIRPVYPE